MKTRIVIACFVTLIFASVGYAQKLYIDADSSYDFHTFKTYAWSSGQIAPNPVTGQLLVAAVERELNARGLVKNEATPDIQIAIMAAPDMDLQGVGPTWNHQRYKSWGGYSNPAALVTLSKGAMMIDLLETKNKFSVWRGVAKDIFVQPPTGNVAKDRRNMEELVDKTIKKMFKKYPVKHP